nr:hypothetical protein [uncultured Flavobacterium sp.]
MSLKYFVIIICAFCVLACGADKKPIIYEEAKDVVVDDKNSNPDLPKLYKKLLDSESFIKMNKLTNDFIAKLNMKTFDATIFKDKTTFENWLKTNITQTKFKSIDEALDLFRELTEANALCHKENAEYYTAYVNATSDADIMEYSPISPDN